MTNETVETNPDMEIEAASFRLTTIAVENNRVAVPSRLYVLERKRSDGSWERMRRVQSFKFECSAGTNEFGLLTIVQNDFDPVDDPIQVVE
jgi:hypothetical protein